MSRLFTVLFICVGLLACSDKPSDEVAGEEKSAAATQAGSGPDKPAARQASTAEKMTSRSDASPDKPPSTEALSVPEEPEAVYVPPPDAELPEEVAQEYHQEADDVLRARKPDQIWKEWDSVIQRANPDEVDMAVAALADALRDTPDGDVERQIEERLYDEMYDVGERLALIDALQLSATPRSLRTLLDYMQRLPSVAERSEMDTEEAAELNTALLEAVEGTARVPVGEDPNWDLSPELERTWSGMTPENSVEELSAVADGIAHLSTDAGARTLLETAGNPDLTETNIGDVARKAVSKVRSLDAFPAMQEALEKTEPGSPLEEAVVTGYVSIGVADASIALVDYLERSTGMSDQEVEDLGATMLERGYPGESIKVFNDALENADISDARVRAMLEEVVAAASDEPEKDVDLTAEMEPSSAEQMPPDLPEDVDPIIDEGTSSK